MHVHHLPIPLTAPHDGGDEHERVFGDEIPDTSLVALVMACVCLEVEFQGGGEGQERN